MPSKQFHLAGLVPCVDKRRQLKFPWDDYLHPIGWNLLAVERAILECAFVGCKTIWVILDKRVQLLLRKRIGESILDPKSYNLYLRKHPSKHRREIPIYYVPLHPRDAYQRSSQIWATIYGAKLVDQTSRQMSSWIAPDKFYVANPFAIYPYEPLIKERLNVSSKKNRFIVSTPDGKTFQDGASTAFTFTPEEAHIFYKIFRSKEIRQYDPASYRGTQDRSKKKQLPIKERYSGRRMKLQEVYGEFDLHQNCEQVIDHQTEFYYELRKWTDFQNFIKETPGLTVPRYLFKNREFTRIETI